MTDTQTRLADDPQMPTTGAVLGDRYEIRNVLGEGGFAVVYRAFDSRTKADVAVKVLDPLMSRRREFASRFMREVETVSRLRHHNTISIFDAGETPQGCLYLVMELLEGKPLDSILESEGKLPEARVRHIADQILKSLQEAHAKGIIHRDLKPANVFLADLAGERDYVKVLDFGIAKSLDESQDTSLTATGQVMCSPHYVAPERVKDHLTVPASDLYSLGIMMMELLDGRPPYEAESPMMLAVKHLTAEAVPFGPDSGGAAYAQVIERSVSKSLDDRFTSAEEMLTALRTAPKVAPSATTTLGAHHENPATQSLESNTTATDVDVDEVPRSKRGVWLVAALLLLVGAAGAFVLSSGGEEPGEVAPASEESVAVAEPEPVVEPEPEPPAIPPTDVPGALRGAQGAIATAIITAERDQAIEAARELSAEEASARAAEEEARRSAAAAAARRAAQRNRRPAPTPEPEPEPVAVVPEPEPEPEPEPTRRPRPIRTDLAPR